MARRWAGPTRAEYEEVLSSEQIVDMARLRGYARHGVTSAVRGDVWMHLLGVLAADTAGEASAVRAMLQAWADTPVAHPAHAQIQQCAEQYVLSLSRVPSLSRRRIPGTRPTNSSDPLDSASPALSHTGTDPEQDAARAQQDRSVQRVTAVVGAFLNTHTPPDDAPASPPPATGAARRSVTPAAEPEWPGSPPQADDMDLDWAIPRTSHPKDRDVGLLPFSSPEDRRASVLSARRPSNQAPLWWTSARWHPALVYLCAPLVESIEADAGAFFSFEALMARLERRYLPSCGGRVLSQRVGEFLSLLRQTAPSLSLYFEEEGINLAPLATEWLQTLLAKQLPLPDTLRLWDTYFALDPARGDEFTDLHTYVCVAILSAAHDLLEELDKAEAIAWLTHLPHQDIPQIVNDAINLRLSHRQHLQQQQVSFQQRFRPATVPDLLEAQLVVKPSIL